MANIDQSGTKKTKKEKETRRQNLLNSRRTSKTNQATFTCDFCGCVFRASEYEYSTESSTYKNGKIIRKVRCACPECFSDCSATTDPIPYNPGGSSSNATETWYVQVLGRRIWWKNPKDSMKEYAKDNLRTKTEVKNNSYMIEVTLDNTNATAAEKGAYYRIWNKVNTNYVKGTILGLFKKGNSQARYWVKTKNGKENLPTTMTASYFLNPSALKRYSDTSNLFYLESTKYSGTGGAVYTKPTTP